MSGVLIALVVVAVLVLVGLALSVRIVQQYERGVLFRLGRVVGVREPGLRLIVPVIEVLRRVSLRIVTMPIQSQGIITRDNVSVDVSAVAYYRVTDATKSVVAIENVAAAINQIAQTTLRKVVGQHTLDQTLAETDTINVAIREILDGTTEAWGVVVTLVELKDIQLPETMQRAMARQAEAEREKRAKIIAAEGEQLAADQLGAASDVMMAHPLALQLRNLQSLVEIGVDQNTTVVFPAPLMSTIQELGRSWPENRPPAPPQRQPLPRPPTRPPSRRALQHPPSRSRQPRQGSTPTTTEHPPPVREANLNQPALLAATVALAALTALGGAGIPTHLAMWLIVPEQTKASWAGGAVKPWRKLTTGVDLGRAAVRKRAVPVERRWAGLLRPPGVID